MSWITAWRRHPFAGYAVLVLGLGIMGTGYGLLTPDENRAEAAAAGYGPTDVAKGKALFENSCASCHGLNGEGTRIAPSLIGVGAAAVDFQVGTGRMPAESADVQEQRKKPVFNQEQINQLAAYVHSLGGGPKVPSAADVDPTKGDPVLGGQLFRANCIQCHNFAGSGGALTRGRSAPSLKDATPTQIYEAMVTGPLPMPVFSDATVTPEQKRAIIAYIVGMREQPNPGGASLGRLGPVAEGFFGWLVGIGLLVGAAMWITAKHRHD